MTVCLRSLSAIDRLIHLRSTMGRLWWTTRLKANYGLVCRKFTSQTNHCTEAMSEYESVIGLEVHCQIASKSKLFSPSATSYTAPPNTQVSPFDCALPGTLPVVNRKCVEATILTGLALNCNISKRSAFDRKHYFYADMPAGYQITQQRHPLATDGFIDFIVINNNKQSEAYLKRSKLKQIQLEQDSGKSLQDELNHIALVDLNRAGVALMEFVFEPDLRSADEAVSLVKELVLVLKSIGTSTCKMQEGVLRVDANVSVNKVGQPFGVRTEVKNLNSFRFIHSAIEYEIKRQLDLLRKSQQVVNETRRYDQKLRQTVPMRDKEVVQDYRFMPEPNIPPILLSEDNHDENLININQIKRTIDSTFLPSQLREMLKNIYRLSLAKIFILMNDNHLTSLFFKVCQSSQTNEFEITFDFLNLELRTLLDESKISFDMCPIEAQTLSKITDLLSQQQISYRIAKRLLKLSFDNKCLNPIRIVEENNWTLINDKKAIEKACLKTIESNPKAWRKYCQKRVKKQRTRLIEDVMQTFDHRVNECIVWQQYDSILANEKSV